MNHATLQNLANNRKTYKYSWPSLEFCWLCIFRWIKFSGHSCSMWDKLGWLNWFLQFICESCYSCALSCSLCEKGLPFCGFLLMFLTSFTSLNVLLLFPLQITFLFILFHLTQMKFSRSTHLLVCLSLETLISIIKSG